MTNRSIFRSKFSHHVRVWLQRRGVAIARTRRGTPAGLNLDADLSLVVNSQNPTIYDVGANVGQSIDMFRRVFPAATIVAFEPASENCLHLRSRYSNGKVSIREVALGSCDETRRFHEFDMSTMDSFLEIDIHAENRFRHLRPRQSVMVTISTVDAERVRRDDAQIDLLKVDTQGFDLQVLKGARNSFLEKRINNVLIELLFSPMYKGQATALEILFFLQHQGFALVDFYEKVRHASRMAWCTALLTRLDNESDGRLPSMSVMPLRSEGSNRDNRS